MVLLILAIIIATSYVLFAPHISAFLYNRSESVFGQSLIQVLQDSQDIEDLIEHRRRIAGTLPTDLTDLTNLSGEVMKRFDTQDSALVKMADISSRQSWIPLLEKGLKNYHSKKVTWINAQREYLAHFKKIKQIEYKVYDFSSRSYDARKLVYAPEPMDSGVWMKNSAEAGTLVQKIREDIQTATEENILTPEYSGYLVADLNEIEALAQLNLRALSGEINWEQWEKDLKALSQKKQEDSIDLSLERVEAWRQVVIKPLEDKKIELYDKKEAAYSEMRASMDTAPILTDAITSFLVKRGIMKLPKLEIREMTNNTLLPSELEAMTNMLKDPDIIFIREAINKYSTKSKDVCIKPEALKKGENGSILSGLDLFDPKYYKSKFTPISKNTVNKNTNYIRVLFIDNPDRIFTAYVENNGASRCMAAFFADEDEKEDVKLMVEQYKQYLFDPKYSL